MHLNNLNAPVLSVLIWDYVAKFSLLGYDRVLTAKW